MMKQQHNENSTDKFVLPFYLDLALYLDTQDTGDDDN